MPPVRRVAYLRPLHGLLRATQWLRLERAPALNDGIADCGSFIRLRLPIRYPFLSPLPVVRNQEFAY
jgi:hypothetical protein